MDGYQVGDHVVFRKNPAPPDPGFEPEDMPPAYVDACPPRSNVDQYWTVRAVSEDGSIDVVNGEGKLLRLKSSNPRLCKAGFFTELWHGRQFPVPRSIYPGR